MVIGNCCTVPLPEVHRDHGHGASIWSVGFGTRERHHGSAVIDPRTLAITPIDPGDADAPQGAQGLGRSGGVLGQRTAYIDSVTCSDARTGAVIRSYLADGPVLSMRGAIYAIRSTTVIRMPTTGRCTG